MPEMIRNCSLVDSWRRINESILKTFSKSYGLAGLRIGYLIANQKFNKILNTVRSSYDISHFSIKVAEYFLKKNEKLPRHFYSKIEKSYSDLKFH